MSDPDRVYALKALIGFRRGLLREKPPAAKLPLLVPRGLQVERREDEPTHDWRATKPGDLWDDPHEATPWAPSEVNSMDRQQRVPSILNAAVLEDMLQKAAPAEGADVGPVEAAPIRGDRSQGQMILSYLHGQHDEQLSNHDIVLNANHNARLKEMVQRQEQVSADDTMTMEDFLRRQRNQIGERQFEMPRRKTRLKASGKRERCSSIKNEEYE